MPLWRAEAPDNSAVINQVEHRRAATARRADARCQARLDMPRVGDVARADAAIGVGGAPDRTVP
jgi:hypothetical protein